MKILLKPEKLIDVNSIYGYEGYTGTPGTPGSGTPASGDPGGGGGGGKLINSCQSPIIPGCGNGWGNR